MGTKRNGKSKQRDRRRGRAGGARRDEFAVFDGVCHETLTTQGRDVLHGGDPAQAEWWASYLVGLWRASPLIGEADPADAIGGRMVSIARRARTPEAVMALRALAAVADGSLRRRATTAARELDDAGAEAPSWVAMIGTAQATAAWRATDLCGDQDAWMIGFAYPDGTEHCVMVLVDHPLGGIAKDAAVLGPVDEVVGHWRRTSDIDVVAEPIEVAAGRVTEAMAWTSRTEAPPVTEDYRDTAALLASRLVPIAATPEEREPLEPEAREELVRSFLADPAGVVYADDPGAWFLIDCAVDYRCEYGGGDPLRWSPAVAELFLLDYVPRRLTAVRSNLARMPDVLRTWVSWGSKRAGLPARLVAETLELIDAVEDEYGEALDDERRWGPAKRLAMRMLAAGVDLDDVDGANAWLAEQLPA